MEPVKAHSYLDQISDLLKDAILRGTYQPGQKLNEAELSRSLGTSRVPIREAFQKLASEGLIKLMPFRGAFVHKLSLEEILELYEVREVLESTAARLAVLRAEQDQLEELALFLDRTKAEIEESGYSAYPWNFDFHQQIARCAKNKKLEMA